MSPHAKEVRSPLGIILPLDEVKRRVIIDALDKCNGSYLMAARLLGIGKTTLYVMAKTYNYQAPSVQARALMTVLPRQPLDHERLNPKSMGSRVNCLVAQLLPGGERS
jgi:Bacterial regulatory protein, Fis family